MVKKSINCPEDEPTQRNFTLPSEGVEHCFQVVDVFTHLDEMGIKLGLGEDTVVAKLEVSGGEEEGRGILNRVSLDDEWKGFFTTRLFLKAINEPYKGKIDIDSDNWIGKCFWGKVLHEKSTNGKVYANLDINGYNFDKPVKQATEAVEKEEIAWDDNG